MKVMIGARRRSLSSGSASGAGGSEITSSSLWTPAPFSRFSRSNTNPCFSQTLAAISASIAAVGATNTCSWIRSAMIWNGLSPRRSASSLTMIGGLMLITLPSGPSESSGSGAAASAGAGAGATGWRTISGSGVSSSREIDGRALLPDFAVLWMPRFLSDSSKRSRACFLASSIDGCCAASRRCRSRRDGRSAGESIRFRTSRFGGGLSLSLCSGIRWFAGVCARGGGPRGG